jgi:hypothetical protein
MGPRHATPDLHGGHRRGGIIAADTPQFEPVAARNVRCAQVALVEAAADDTAVSYEEGIL